MLDPGPMFRWIDAQFQRMCDLTATWGRINSGTPNIAGVARMADAVAVEIAPLGRVERIELPGISSWDHDGRPQQLHVGPALRIVHRPGARRRFFIGIHLDTVYDEADPFQHVESLDADTLRGPGVADAKGGLVVLITALRALQQADLLGDLGFTLALNPDEELGSPASTPFLIESAKNCQFGLLYEPALPDGGLVSARKASSNFVAVIHGRAAHAGRDLYAGRNAIEAASELTLKLRDLNDRERGIGVNVGALHGGGPLNVVPALATVGFNIRSACDADQRRAVAAVHGFVGSLNQRDGIKVELRELVACPAKPATESTQKLLGALFDCGKQLGLNLTHRATGGVSDGNRLAAAGLPNIDNLGVRGGDIHSHQEFIKLGSLTERAKLTALLIARLAADELPWVV